MKNFFTLICVVTALNTFAQKSKSLELSTLVRHDIHAKYITNFANRVFNDTLKLSGTSFGLNLGIRQNLFSNLSAHVAIGYYRLAVDRIRGSNRINPSTPKNNRHIDYSPDSTLVLYSTDRYHYNNLAFTVGLDKTFMLKKQLGLHVGIEGIAYRTFEQVYRIGNDKYVTKNKKPLEFGVNFGFGLTKDFSNFYLKPSILIPVYQSLRGDKNFYEAEKMQISKSFSGVGLKLAIGKYL